MWRHILLCVCVFFFMYARSYEEKCICALCICMFPPESVYGINGRNADNCLDTQLFVPSRGEETET